MFAPQCSHHLNIHAVGFRVRQGIIVRGGGGEEGCRREGGTVVVEPLPGMYFYLAVVGAQASWQSP